MIINFLGTKRLPSFQQRVNKLAAEMDALSAERAQLSKDLNALDEMLNTPHHAPLIRATLLLKRATLQLRHDSVRRRAKDVSNEWVLAATIQSNLCKLEDAAKHRELPHQQEL